MSQELVEVTPPSDVAPGQEQPQFQETDSLAHTAESTIALPTQTEGFPQLQKSWRQRARYLVFRRSVGVFIALIVVATVYFCPVILSKAPDGEVEILSLDSDAPVCPSGATGQAALSDRYPQVTLLGIVPKFDWLATETVPVVWSPLVLESDVAPMHLYINKWVQIRLFQYLKVTQR